MSNHEIPMACDMNALPDRARHETVGETLMPQALSVTALDDGYQVEFPVDALTLVAEFINGERLCCPFFHFRIHVAPAAESVQLQLTGPAGVKGILESELLSRLPVTAG